MDLFAGFHEHCFAAYNESYPLEEGWEMRLKVYQLYYLLAHVNIHGASWMDPLKKCLRQLR